MYDDDLKMQANQELFINPRILPFVPLEEEILRIYNQGHNILEIAEMLDIEIETIRNTIIGEL